ncbi:MAG: CDP-alcohol phosphatidyltransferase family protein [Urechidicola sp.]|nr:CDP-alcohol phosphatidyltransferase family protein [Urechidicola sp.]
MKKQIPNIFTLANLFSGMIAVIYAVSGDLMMAGFFVLLGIFFDFFDGFFARLLKVSSEFGKQLDSLADMVTSGVVPGIILMKLLEQTVNKGTINGIDLDLFGYEFETVTLIGIVFTLAAAYRLANFNIDERQTSSFIGLPTPAATLVVISLPFILEHNSIEVVESILLTKWFLIGMTVLLSVLMNANIPLFSLKFKEYSWKTNKIKYIYLLLSVLYIVLLQFLAVPLIILTYVVLSLVENNIKKQ